MAAKRAEFSQGTPPPGTTDTEVIRLTREGVWLADGHEITHEPTRRLFARSLEKDEAGYFLHIGREMKRIEVEDTAYFVEAAMGSPERGYRLRISDGTEQDLDETTLAYRPGRLICRIENGTEPAKFLPPAYMEILRPLEEDATHYFVTLRGKRIELAPR